MPRRPNANGNDIDYSQLFSQKYADYYAIPDPANAAHNLTLCELFQKGLVNDIFLVVNKTAPDDQMPEILEYKQEYDNKDVKKPGKFDQYAGNGFFDKGDIPAVNACGLSVRIGFLEMTGVLGNSMQVNAHNYEHIGINAVLHFDEMFKPFANFDMDTRYGTSFANWYDQCSTSDNKCISYPDKNSGHFHGQGRVAHHQPLQSGLRQRALPAQRPQQLRPDQHVHGAFDVRALRSARRRRWRGPADGLRHAHARQVEGQVRRQRRGRRLVHVLVRELAGPEQQCQNTGRHADA